MVPIMTNVVIKKYHAIIFLKPIPILRITEIANVIIRRTKRIDLVFWNPIRFASVL